MSRLHVITAEQSPLRRWALYIFARYVELPLLKCGYLLLRGRCRRLGQSRLLRTVLAWAAVAPFGYLGDTARPLPTAKVLELIDKLEGPMAVGPCHCRSAHLGCDHPLETDLVIRTGVEAWTRAFPHEYRPISKEDAKQIVRDCRRLGMWQMVFVHCPVNLQNEYVICNCCPCGCVPYLLNRELGQRVYPLLRGQYTAVADASRCAGHGDCVGVCPFGARALVGGRSVLVKPCFGCGLCVDACPVGAITVSDEEIQTRGRRTANRENLGSA